MKAGYVLACAFLSGAAVMVVEMTAVRVLQPFFGSTNYVWANVIAVVLAALSLGYWVGGRLADRRPQPSTFFAVLIVGGLLVLASIPCATPLSMWLQPGTVDMEGVMGVLIRGSLAASLVLFAPAMAVLGAVSPVAVRLLADAGAGRAAGRVFAISTLGSLVGTYLATLWLVPELGSRRTLLVAAAMLVVPGGIGLAVFAGRGGAVAALLAVIIGAPVAATAETRPGRPAPPLADGGVAKLLAELETPYQYVTVRDDVYRGRSERLLTINEGVYTYHSLEVQGSVLTDSRYYDDYAMLPLLVDVPFGEPLRGCVVGLACGITPRQWIHFWGSRWRLDIDGAELDPAILDAGRRWFHVADSERAGLRSFVMDGRQMLAALPPSRRYHMLVVDAFTNELYIPFHLGTREFFALCRDRLEDGGVLAMNVYAYRPDSANLLALENTLADVFGSALRIRQTWGGNFLLLARRGDSPPALTRLTAARIEERVGPGDRPSEWAAFETAAVAMPDRSLVVRRDPARRILTDDDAPLEHLTDVFLGVAESEVLGR